LLLAVARSVSDNVVVVPDTVHRGLIPAKLVRLFYGVTSFFNVQVADDPVIGLANDNVTVSYRVTRATFGVTSRSNRASVAELMGVTLFFSDSPVTAEIMLVCV
jgi:hypothetical protein